MRVLSLLVWLSLFAWAQTLPTGGAYVAGSGDIASAGSTMTITQSSARGIINWQGFSIGAGGKVQFNNGSGATARISGNVIAGNNIGISTSGGTLPGQIISFRDNAWAGNGGDGATPFSVSLK